MAERAPGAGRGMVGTTMVAAPLALAVSALAMGASPWEPSWWRAAVHLAVLGGIAMMIYAVNIRVVPVFSRRRWRSNRLLAAQLATGGAGAWLGFVGIGLGTAWLEGLGAALALVGGVLFMVNIVSLFRQEPAGPPAPPARDPGQPAVDRIATGFMRLAGTSLVLGLAIGLMRVWWEPERGRWELVWAHLLLLGFFLTMASGVCYHVLSRWSGQPWRSVAAIRWHYRLVAAGLPLMLLALAADLDRLLLVAGPLQAAALALLLGNAAPLVWRLGPAPRLGITLAGVFLLAGIGLGAAFAIDPAIGARLRQAHAVANLFGWTGLLISGFGYVLAPSFAGARLRWPRLARVQIAVLAAGAAAGVVAAGWRIAGDGPDAALLGAQAAVAVGLALFAAQVAAVFRTVPLSDGTQPIRPRPARGRPVPRP